MPCEKNAAGVRKQPLVFSQQLQINFYIWRKVVIDIFDHGFERNTFIRAKLSMFFGTSKKPKNKCI